MKLDIKTPPNKILRIKTKPVVKFGKELQTLIDNMIETMRESSGMGLAAPQVGRDMQLAVIETPPKVDDEGEEIPDTRDLYVIVNPKITWRSRKINAGIEGCLSIPGYVGEVDRPIAIRVKGQNRAGKKVNMRLKGWAARIFQHEVDHLNGILYTDRLTSPENYWTEDEFEAMQKAAQEAREAEEKAAEMAEKRTMVFSS